jgi:hypothetical protein
MHEQRPQLRQSWLQCSRLIRTAIRLTRTRKCSFDAIGYLCDRFAQAQLMRNPEDKLALDDRCDCLSVYVRGSDFEE